MWFFYVAQSLAGRMIPARLKRPRPGRPWGLHRVLVNSMEGTALIAAGRAEKFTRAFADDYKPISPASRRRNWESLGKHKKLYKI